ncbi:MAG: hypothetical protein P8175_02310 [Deltaproteobacteria bacterium]
MIEQETLPSVLIKAWAMTKFKIPMSKLKIQNLWHWGLGLDFASELRALAFEISAKQINALERPSVVKQGIFPWEVMRGGYCKSRRPVLLAAFSVT